MVVRRVGGWGVVFEWEEMLRRGTGGMGSSGMGGRLRRMEAMVLDQEEIELRSGTGAMTSSGRALTPDLEPPGMLLGGW